MHICFQGQNKTKALILDNCIRISFTILQKLQPSLRNLLKVRIGLNETNIEYYCHYDFFITISEK